MRDKKQFSIRKKDLRKFYTNKEIYSWAFDTLKGYSDPSQKLRFMTLLDLIDYRKNEKILDVGCGGS